MIPLLFTKYMFPLILVVVIQHFICKNKPQYSLVIPSIALFYFLAKFIVLGNIPTPVDEYTPLIRLLIFFMDSIYFIVTFLQHRYAKRRNINHDNYIKTKIQDL